MLCFVFVILLIIWGNKSLLIILNVISNNIDQILEDVNCFDYLGSKIDEAGGT